MKKKVLTYSELESFIADIQTTSIDFVDARSDLFKDDWHSIFGKVAVMIDQKEVWIDSSPHYLATCMEKLNGIVNGISAEKISNHLNPMNYYWDSFVGTAISKLFISDPNNPKYLNLIGLWLLKTTYGIIKDMFKVIGDNLGWGNTHFVVIQNIVIERALIFGSEKTSVNSTLSRSGIDALLDPFLRGSTSPELIQWSDRLTRISQNNNNVSSKRFHYTSSNRKTSCDLIYKAFTNIHPLTENLSNENRLHYFLFWHQVLKELKYEWQGLADDDDRNPYLEHDSWKMSHLCLTILFATNEENPNSFWKEMFEHGVKLNEWLSRFLEHYHRYGMAYRSLKSNYEVQHHQMLDHAYKTSAWRDSSWPPHREMWFSLHSVSKTLIDPIWNQPLTQFHTDLWSRISPWVFKTKFQPELLNMIIQILRTPAGECLIHDGLKIIEDYFLFYNRVKNTPIPAGIVFTTFEYYDSLAKSMSYLWEKQRFRIEHDVVTYKRFKYVIKELAFTRNPMGLILLDILG
jgi:hypothetical protein